MKKDMSIQIREALVSEAGCLSELSLRSKAHWAYPAEFINAVAEELSVTPKDLEDDNYHCFVAFNKTRVLGYFALTEQSAKVVELEALFVDPDHIGQGLGRLLMDHAKSVAAGLGADKMIIQSDPYALGFYQAAGGMCIGERESGSVPGRYLPVLEISLIS